MGTQKNRLDETVLLSTQNTFKLMDKKIIAILRLKGLLNWPFVACHLLITFANSLDPDLKPNCVTLIVFLKENLAKNSRGQKKA